MAHGASEQRLPAERRAPAAQNPSQPAIGRAQIRPAGVRFGAFWEFMHLSRGAFNLHHGFSRAYC